MTKHERTHGDIVSQGTEPVSCLSLSLLGYEMMMNMIIWGVCSYFNGTQQMDELMMRLEAIVKTHHLSW